MPKNDSAIVVDRRVSGWFHLDNALIDRYGAQIGTTSIAVYALLARYANRETGQAFPAYKTICKSLGISINTAIVALRRLEHAGLITIERQAGGDGHGTEKNIYTLCPIAQHSAKTEEGGVQKLKRGGSKIEEGGVQKLTYPSSVFAMEQDSINKKDHDHESVIPPPPSPTRASEKSGDGDGDGRTLSFLIDRGVGAAQEFAHLPFEPMQLDFDNRLADGWTIALIVRAWRAGPPTENYHYERRTTPDQSGRPVNHSKRGSHNGTGGQDLKNPGWMDRELARLGIENPEL